jgi:antitoxin VapB
MPRTRIFKSGNSHAIRIPAEIAYADPDIDLQINRHGDVLTIYPRRDGLTDALATLRRMPKPPAVERREPIELPDRDRD